MRNHIQPIFIKLILAIPLTIACKHTPDPLPAIHIQTFIPDATNSDPEPIQTLLVPSELIFVGEITRQMVEVREGPGTEFPLLDRLLTSSTPVVVIDSFGVWTKVYIPDHKFEGWIHHRTFRRMSNPPVFLELPIDRFPKVFTRRELFEVFDYQSKKAISYSTPKGRQFRRLAKQGNMVLVYLPETRSIAWLMAGDVR